jgi:hypothetical protein
MYGRDGLQRLHGGRKGRGKVGSAALGACEILHSLHLACMYIQSSDLCSEPRTSGQSGVLQARQEHRTLESRTSDCRS